MKERDHLQERDRNVSIMRWSSTNKALGSELDLSVSGLGLELDPGENDNILIA
jgi:hypothetical protein